VAHVEIREVEEGVLVRAAAEPQKVVGNSAPLGRHQSAAAGQGPGIQVREDRHHHLAGQVVELRLAKSGATLLQT